MIALLAGLLFTLLSLLCSNPFTTAHTARQAETTAGPGTGPPSEAVREESVTRRTTDGDPGPTGPPPLDDRPYAHRAAPGWYGRGAAEDDPAAAHEPAAPTGRHRPPRPGPAPTPAALQVFRC